MADTLDAEHQRLQEELDLVRAVANTVPSMLAYWDAEQRCRYANRAYELWVGVKHDELIGRTIGELLGLSYETLLPHILGALRGEPQTFDRETVDPSGGLTRYSQVAYVPDTVDGDTRGFFALIADISQRKRLEDELRASKDAAEALATHDFLTGLPNRLLLTDRVTRAIKMAERTKSGVGVLFIDLDGFKGVNDGVGHAAGDDLLVQVARRLEASVRKSDSVARLGGDEFIVLLPTLSAPEDVGVVAQTLLDGMDKEPFVAQGRRLEVSASIGTSSFPNDGNTVEALLAAADAALREAKRSGKNRWASHHS